MRHALFQGSQPQLIYPIGGAPSYDLIHTTKCSRIYRSFEVPLSSFRQPSSALLYHTSHNARPTRPRNRTHRKIYQRLHHRYTRVHTCSPSIYLTLPPDQAKATYGFTYPNGHDWSVILDSSSQDKKTIACVIVYTSTNSLKEWRVLAKGPPRFDGTSALRELLETLQRKMNTKGH